MTSTKEVLAHHLQAFGERDLEGVLSDYAPDAVFFTRRGPLRGTDTIRPLFEGLIAEFAKPGATFRMQQQFVAGDYAYILRHGETAENIYELGTDTFVVRNGKIVAPVIHGQDYTETLKDRNPLKFERKIQKLKPN